MTTFTAATEELLPPCDHKTITAEVEPILADISDRLWHRAEVARRAPTSRITVDNVPSSMIQLFKTWKVGGELLFRPSKPARDGAEPRSFWSFRPEACHALCRFEDMAEEQNRPTDPGRIHAETFIRAAGNARLSKRDDMAVITVPISVDFKSTPVGQAKKRCKSSMVMSFTVMVVPASKSAMLKAHNKYPGISDHKSWPQMPWFGSPIEHHSRHLQRLVQEFGLLDRTAISVQAILS